MQDQKRSSLFNRRTIEEDKEVLKDDNLDCRCDLGGLGKTLTSKLKKIRSSLLVANGLAYSTPHAVHRYHVKVQCCLLRDLLLNYSVVPLQLKSITFTFTSFYSSPLKFKF